MQFFLFFFELQFFAANCSCRAALAQTLNGDGKRENGSENGKREKTIENKAHTRKHSGVMVLMYLGFLRLWEIFNVICLAWRALGNYKKENPVPKHFANGTGREVCAQSWDFTSLYLCAQGRNYFFRFFIKPA